MKKISSKVGIEGVLQRIAQAYGANSHEDLVDLMPVQPETLRTWRKRGEVPLSRLREVAKATGKGLDWLISGEGPFFAEAGKQISPASVREADPPAYDQTDRMFEVIAVVLEALEEQGLHLPPRKVAELTRLIYQHDASHRAAGDPQPVKSTTEQFLRLVA